MTLGLVLQQLNAPSRPQQNQPQFMAPQPLRKLHPKSERPLRLLAQVDCSIRVVICFCPAQMILFVASGIADSVVGKISNAVGRVAIKAVDGAFTAGESALESAKQTTIGKVLRCILCVSCLEP